MKLKMKKRVICLWMLILLLTGCAFTSKDLVEDIDIIKVPESGNIVVFEEEPVEEVNEDGSDSITTEEEMARENAGVTENTVASYSPDPVTSYYYEGLSDKERSLYAELYLIMTNHAEEIVVSSIDKDEIDHVFHCVLYDHPEIFYVQGYSYTKHTLNGVITRIDFTPTYTYTQNEIFELQQIGRAHV